LPLPVLAMATTSRLLIATLQDWAWMGVGSAKPARWISAMMSGGNCAAANVVNGSGGESPCTDMSQRRRHSCTSGPLEVLILTL